VSYAVEWIPGAALVGAVLLVLIVPSFALIGLVVVALGAVAALVALAGAILATPYLLVRHLRRHRTGHLSVSSPAVQLVSAQSQRARA
jgi:hypothetical protein